MSEDEIFDILDLMLESTSLVESRFTKIERSEDFVSTSDGVTLLDAIVMRLKDLPDKGRNNCGCTSVGFSEKTRQIIFRNGVKR